MTRLNDRLGASDRWEARARPREASETPRDPGGAELDFDRSWRG
jgi:hypothetical protein